MTNDEEINKKIEILFNEINDKKVLIKLLKHEIEKTIKELKTLQKELKKETTAQ